MNQRKDIALPASMKLLKKKGKTASKLTPRTAFIAKLAISKIQHKILPGHRLKVVVDRTTSVCSKYLRTLICSNNYSVDDLINATTSGQIIYRLGKALQNWADGLSTRKALYQLITNITGIQSRKN